MNVRGSDSEHALHRAVWWLLALTIGFILYASLYPFDFDPDRVRMLDRETLLRTLAWRRPSRSDLIANLIFYLPFGALVTYLTRRRWGFAKRCLIVLASGVALSITVECLQFATRHRDPALTDITFNGVSALLGAVIALSARQLGMKPALPQLRAHRPDPIALLLVVMWLAFHAAPFMPTVRFIRYFREPELLLAGEWSAASAAGFFAGYILLGAALRNLLRPASFWPVLGACVVVALVSRILFRGQQLDPNELLGFALALPAIWQVARETEDRAYLRAGVWMAAVLVMFLLAPFDYSADLPTFRWWDGIELTRRTAAGEPGLLELAFLYVGLVWLLCEAGLPVTQVAMWLCLAATGIELAQAWQPGKSANLAGPLTVLAGAVLVWSRRGFA